MMDRGYRIEAAWRSDARGHDGRQRGRSRDRGADEVESSNARQSIIRRSRERGAGDDKPDGRDEAARAFI